VLVHDLLRGIAAGNLAAGATTLAIGDDVQPPREAKIIVILRLVDEHEILILRGLPGVGDGPNLNSQIRRTHERHPSPGSRSGLSNCHLRALPRQRSRSPDESCAARPLRRQGASAGIVTEGPRYAKSHRRAF